jgi:hypothetical protein
VKLRRIDTLAAVAPCEEVVNGEVGGVNILSPMVVLDVWYEVGTLPLIILTLDSHPVKYS